MPDLTAIAAALSSFNELKNIAQAMITLRDAQALQTKIIEFNGALIDAQTKIFAVNEERTALIEKVGALEKEIAQMKAWDAEKQRYELKELREGTFAYALKADAQPPEPAHSICPDCYQDGVKRLLTKVDRFPSRAHVTFCQRCGWEVYISGGWHPEHGATKSASRRTR